MKVAYLLSRYPVLTETFIHREILGVGRQQVAGRPVTVSVYSLRPPGRGPVEGRTRELEEAEIDLHYGSRLRGVGALLGTLLTRPHRAVSAVVGMLTVSWGDPKTFWRALRLIPVLFDFGTRMRRSGVTRIHAHFLDFNGVVAEGIRRLTGIPYSVHPHAFGLFTRPLSTVRRQLRRAPGIVTVSTYHRRWIEEASGRDDAAVVHYGLDPEVFVPEPGSGGPESSPEDSGDASAAGADPGRRPLRILSVARLSAKKGFPDLVDALALLAGGSEGGGSSGPDGRSAPPLDFRCRIVGGGTPDALQRRIDRHGLGDRVVLVGPLPVDAVREEYRRTDLFVLPCLVAVNGDRDGLPNVLIEALASGVPVVTTPVAGIPELVEDGVTGLLAPERSPELLARAIRRMADDPAAARRMALAGRERVLQQHDEEKNAAQLVEIWHRWDEGSRKPDGHA